MKAGCAAQKLQFEAHGKRDVVADFDGGRMTSEGGGLLLREANYCLGDLMARLGQCVSDFRQQGSVEHTATDSDRPARVRARARVRGPQRSRHAAARQPAGLAGGPQAEARPGGAAGPCCATSSPADSRAPVGRPPAPPAPASTASLLTSPSPSAIMVLPSLEQPHLPHTEVSTKP